MATTKSASMPIFQAIYRISSTMLAIVFASASTCFSALASATIINFETPRVTDGSLDSAAYVQDGFVVGVSGFPVLRVAAPGLFAPTQVAFPSFGFQYSALTVRSVDGTTFSTNQFDLVEANVRPSASNLRVVGTRIDGSTIAANFLSDGLAGPQTIMLGSTFNNLVSLRFGGDAATTGDLAIDNLDVSRNSTSVFSSKARLETDNYARFYSASDPKVIYSCDHSDGSACVGSTLAPNTNWTVNYLSRGSASYGILKDYATVSVTGDNALGPFESFESTGARSGYRDSYLITGREGSGKVDFTFAVSGTQTSAVGAAANALFQYVPVMDGREAFSAARNFVVHDGLATVSVPFVFGEPFEFATYFYALAQVFDWQSASSATADYEHTAILSGVGVFDSDNNPVANAFIASASGTNYLAVGLVSEPNSIALFAAALLSLGVRRARGKRVEREFSGHGRAGILSNGFRCG